jgi:uncharacterized membrane protein YdjX (TVP38/TMEM64 family)
MRRLLRGLFYLRVVRAYLPAELERGVRRGLRVVALLVLAALAVALALVAMLAVAIVAVVGGTWWIPLVVAGALAATSVVAFLVARRLAARRRGVHPMRPVITRGELP